MLKRPVILAGILLMLLSVSCNFNKKEECVKLDNEIAAINDSLLWYGSKWGDELEISVNTLEFSGLKPIREEMEAYVERKIERVENMENVGGSEKLVETELKFLKIEKEIVQTKLTAFEQFTDSVTMEELSNTYADMQMSGMKEEELLKEIHRLREEYEEKNDIPKFLEKH